MPNQQLSELAALRRDALIDLCIHAKHSTGGYPATMRLQKAEDVAEWLRTELLNSQQVQTSRVAELVSCLQQYNGFVYNKIEPGYTARDFDPDDVQEWEQSRSYSLWSAGMLLRTLPQDYIQSYVRIGKTRLFSDLETRLNQVQLSESSVLQAVREYLHTFVEISDLDVLTVSRDSENPLKGKYYLVGRQRIAPYAYFTRQVDIEVTEDSDRIPPTAWSQWQEAKISADSSLDCRLVAWGGRLCAVWVESHEALFDKDGQMHKPYELETKVAFIALNGQWSPPIQLNISQSNSDVSKNCRLVAVVLQDENDKKYPQGRLAVHVTNSPADSGTKAGLVNVNETRDPLFRKLPDETAVMDHLAHVRFADPLTVQQQIAPAGLPTSVRSTLPGPLADYLGIKAYIVPKQPSSYTLRVQGYCALAKLGTPTDVDFTLSIKGGDDEDPDPITESHADTGGWSTSWLEIENDVWFANSEITCTLVSETSGSVTVVLKVAAAAPVYKPLPYIDKSNDQGAQFLVFNQETLPKLKNVRLNTTIGPILQLMANLSITALFSWWTQHHPEPAPPDGQVEPHGPFNGCNGLFFWELFFHLPHLVATRLRDEGRFEEAQWWLQLLFDPQSPETAAEDPAPIQPQYWKCRPLAATSAPIDYAAGKPLDPDARAYSNPEIYRIVIFLDFIKNLIDWGDWLFSQLTSDSITAATQQYNRAVYMMGAKPDTRTLNRWEPTQIKTLVDEIENPSALVAFEKTLMLDADQLPVRAARFPHPGVIGTKSFRLPVSERLLSFWEVPAQRLYNVRNNLTLDGRERLVPQFTPGDPAALLGLLAGGASGTMQAMGGQVRVSAFHWRVLFDSAIECVQLLVTLGSETQRCLENRDRAEEEERRQRHLMELSDYNVRMQDEYVGQLNEALLALQRSKVMAEDRKQYFAKLYDENVSDNERKVTEHLEEATCLMMVSGGFRTTAAAIRTAPTIFGTASGNADVGGPPEAVGIGLQIGADAARLRADKTATSESYRRRHEEWGVEQKRASAEIAVIDAQIASQERAINAALANLEQTTKANAQARTMLEFLQQRATSLELYQWMAGQLRAQYFQAFNAAVGACLSAERALQVHTCEFGKSYIRPGVWNDRRFGFTAGTSLHTDLLRMKADYLQRRERPLELVKNISLRELFNKYEQTGYDDWVDALVKMRSSGSLKFEFPALLFDSDFHGHYCRQIKAMEVTFPALIGPYETTNATLTQASSYIAVEASTRSLEYLYGERTGVAPPDVLINLNSGQQVALCRGLNDTGTETFKPDEEGFTQAFENAGVISKWVLVWHWPKRQEQMLLSVDDIVIRMHYTAKVGSATFSERVKEYVNDAERKITSGTKK